MKSPLERIAELERLNAEQQKELAALKAELNKPEANYDGPGKGYYWDRMDRRVGNHSGRIGRTGDRFDGACYATEAEAEWQGNSERVRRKLQRIAKALNPPGWKPIIGSERYEFWNGGLELETARSESPMRGTAIYFASYSLREQAREIIGDDIKYLNWYNSPEFKA